MATISRLQLGVLDLWDLSPSATIALATHAEDLGFSRYWLAEHPPQPRSTALLGLLAGATTSIRVGTAGVLLRFHNPHQTAQDFLMLEALFPGRIDAGFSSADALAEVVPALLDGRTADPSQYASRLREVVGYLRADWPGDHPAAKVPVRRFSVERPPEIWNFGTGERSALLAAREGIAYGYSLMHQPYRDDPTMVDRYHDAFQPSSVRREPLAALAVAVICAESGDRARALAAARRTDVFALTAVGDPITCRDRLGELAARYRVNDLVIVDASPTFEDRRRSLALLAEAFGHG